MTDPITFNSATPRFALPLIYSAQAQKEMFVNEAMSRADAMMHCAIEGTVTAPPTSATDGENWLIGTGGSEDFAGHDGEIACRQEGQWLFFTLSDGMRIFDREMGQQRLFLKEWREAQQAGSPSGGATIDAEARAAINEIITGLQNAGIFPVT